MTKALDRLIDGFKGFYDKNYDVAGKKKMEDLVDNGQHPEIYMVACSDSRSGPNTIFQANAGDIFMGRRIAALIPPFDENDNNADAAAEIDYAVDHLKVKHIVILGHKNCGGVGALASGYNEGSIGKWVGQAKPVIDEIKSKNPNISDIDLADNAERETVIWSLKNLMTYKSVSDAVKEGRLSLHAWQFDIKHGKINEYDIDKNKFVEIEIFKPEKHKSRFKLK